MRELSAPNPARALRGNAENRGMIKCALESSFICGICAKISAQIRGGKSAPIHFNLPKSPLLSPHPKFKIRYPYKFFLLSFALHEAFGFLRGRAWAAWLRIRMLSAFHADCVSNQMVFPGAWMNGGAAVFQILSRAQSLKNMNVTPVLSAAALACFRLCRQACMRDTALLSCEDWKKFHILAQQSAAIAEA